MPMQKYAVVHKGYIRLEQVPYNQIFELPNESGYWQRAGALDSDQEIAVARAHAQQSCRKLYKNTVVIVEC